MKKRDIFCDKIKSIFSKKFFTTNIFGACFIPISSFIVLYYIVFIIYLYGLPSNEICQEVVNNKNQSKRAHNLDLNDPINCNLDKYGYGPFIKLNQRPK